jgi:hypothetical protein
MTERKASGRHMLSLFGDSRRRAIARQTWVVAHIGALALVAWFLLIRHQGGYSYWIWAAALTASYYGGDLLLRRWLVEPVDDH